jgi:hypothetical protein
MLAFKITSRVRVHVRVIEYTEEQKMQHPVKWVGIDVFIIVGIHLDGLIK